MTTPINNRYEFVLFTMWKTVTPTAIRMPEICHGLIQKPATASSPMSA